MGSHSQPGDYTFVATDAGSTVEASGGSPQVFTVPLGVFGFPVDPIGVTQTGAGGVTLVAALPGMRDTHRLPAVPSPFSVTVSSGQQGHREGAAGIWRR